MKVRGQSEACQCGRGQCRPGQRDCRECHRESMRRSRATLAGWRALAMWLLVENLRLKRKA